VSRPGPGLSLALREDSRAALEAGDPGRATALLERAIRIEPRRPELWLDLAEIHLDQGRLARAQQMARRGAALARGRPVLEERAARLLERIAQATLSG
jgi:Tfp pilus assembly protein PilF